jgi:hypothetical protein
MLGYPVKIGEGSYKGCPMLSSGLRQCARGGCHNAVKKPTNKYCSRACCTADPERNERLRESTRKRILPMSKQLDLAMWANEESALAAVCVGVEDLPAGLSRLAAG